MQDSLVSVVVPVWQSEHTIRACVESILQQDYPYLQIVLVDDGCTDKSGKLMDELATKDERIIVVHQKNAGASAARWKGVEKSTGEWLCFVDSDDRLPFSAISDLLSVASEEVDIVLGNGQSLLGESRQLVPIEDFRHMAVRGEGTIGVPWGSLYRRNVLKHYFFDLPRDIVNGEDYIFWLRLVFNTEKPVAILYKEVYDKGPDTISSSFRWSSDYAQKINKLRKAAIPQDKQNEYLSDIVSDSISNFFDLTLWESRNTWSHHSFFEEIKNDMQQTGRSFTWKQRMFLNLPSRWMRRTFSSMLHCFAYVLLGIMCFVLLTLPASYEIYEGKRHFASVLTAVAGIQSVLMLGVIYYVDKYLCFINKTISYILKWILLIIILLLFVTETVSYFLFNSRMNSFVLSTIMQTNGHEVKEFFTTYTANAFSFVIILFILVILSLFYILMKRIKKYTFKRNAWKDVLSIIGLLFMGFVLMNLNIPPGQNTIVRITDSASAVQNNQLDLKKIAADNRLLKVNALKGMSPHIVLIIGESFNKYHSNLYGYLLNTNPQLKKEADKGRLLVFHDVVSPVKFTNQAMLNLFLLNNCNSKENNILQYILMPAVFKKAGYQVNYYDNQYTRIQGGTFDYSCGYFLNPSDISRQCFDYRSDKLFHYDEDFLNEYADRISNNTNTKTFDIIHLYGQHIPFGSRYPDGYGKFSAKDIKRTDLTENERETVAEYDNATLYNDEQIARILHWFDNDDAFVVYISDHGEQIYDDSKHLLGRDFTDDYSPEQMKSLYEIPMMVWCSDKFQTMHDECFQQLKGTVEKPICIDDIAWLLFSVAGIEFDGYHSWHSPISSDYRPHQRMLNGKVYYDKKKAKKSK